MDQGRSDLFNPSAGISCQKNNIIYDLKRISITSLVSILKKTSRDFLMTASSCLQNQIMNWRNYINILMIYIPV